MSCPACNHADHPASCDGTIHTDAGRQACPCIRTCILTPGNLLQHDDCSTHDHEYAGFKPGWFVGPAPLATPWAVAVHQGGSGLIGDYAGATIEEAIAVCVARFQPHLDRAYLIEAYAIADMKNTIVRRTVEATQAASGRW